MSLTQKQRDDLAIHIKGIAEITEPYLSDWEILTFLLEYISEDDYEYIRGEICADKDMMDAYR